MLCERHANGYTPLTPSRPFMPVHRIFILLMLLIAVSSCVSPGYYVQAISGQLDVLTKRRPVEAVLADPATSPGTRKQLELVQRLRAFAVQELKLPDNGSYRSYADLERPFVAWNVFATPALSLEPRKWCFPIAGCTAYRGYFTRKKAEKFAAKLGEQGYDVYIGGVPAYSTLGWFSDPLLNTFIHRPEAELAGLLFHELAHQVVFVKGDTAFNESFATVMELEGVRRWFERLGTARQAQAYRMKLERREEFTALVLKHRARLARIYASDRNPDEKRAAKDRIFDDMRREYAALKTGWDGYAAFDNWFAQDLNNAHLAAIGLYHQHVPAFQKLLQQQDGDLTAFYALVRKMADSPFAERTARLQELARRAS